MSSAAIDFLLNTLIYIVLGVVPLLGMIGSVAGPAPIPWWLRAFIPLYALMTLPMTALAFLFCASTDLLTGSDGVLDAATLVLCEVASLVAVWLIVWTPVTALARALKRRSATNVTKLAWVARWVLVIELGLVASPYALGCQGAVTSLQTWGLSDLIPVTLLEIFPLAAGVYLMVASAWPVACHPRCHRKGQTPRRLRTTARKVVDAMDPLQRAYRSSSRRCACQSASWLRTLWGSPSLTAVHLDPRTGAAAGKVSATLIHENAAEMLKRALGIRKVVRDFLPRLR